LFEPLMARRLFVNKKEIKKLLEPAILRMENQMIRFKEFITERGDDSKGHFISTEKGAGMTAKGVKAFRAKNPGSKLQTAVTGKAEPGSKDAKRRKSFCARMSGMPGPMKDEKGRPTRKAMSLRRWKCN
jgi:hypothetical protein